MMRWRFGGGSVPRRAAILATALLVGLPLVGSGPVSRLDGATAPTSAGDTAAAPATQAPVSDSTAPEPTATTGAWASSSMHEPEIEGYTAARPATAPPAVSEVSAPGGATPVRLTRDTALCGVGMTQVQLLGGDRGVSCVHTFNDPAPTRPANKGAVRMQPICRGNGVNGPRIQFLYVFVEGRPNRIAEYAPHMVNSWIPAMEGAFRSTSAEQGREVGMRVHMPNCEIEIGVVELPEPDGEPDNPGAMRARIEQAVRDAGYTSSNRKYHVWFDGANKGACGVAPAILFPVAGDNATPANPNNLGTAPVVDVLPQVAVTFKHAVPVDPNSAPMCFGRGGMGALTEIHELIHLLGAVSYSAPNSNGLGHCRDEVDIMCYSEGGVLTEVRCNVEIEQLDCGSDDYFNSRPQIGSYLSYNWNTANSKFLGDALEDQVPAEIPRP